jgi:alpha-L-fucosidase
MFEKDLPGQNTAGFNEKSEIGKLPLETCETINNSWGYNESDKRFKSTKALIHYLVRAAGHNANFLLNAGPMPNGKIQPEFVSRLAEMGEWLKTNGESIHGTRGGPFTPRNWGAATQKGNKIYVHVLDWSDELLAIPPVANVKSASILKTGQKVSIQNVRGGLLLRLPKAQLDPVDTIVVLERSK